MEDYVNRLEVDCVSGQCVYDHVWNGPRAHNQQEVVHSSFQGQSAYMHHVESVCQPGRSLGRSVSACPLQSQTKAAADFSSPAQLPADATSSIMSVIQQHRQERNVLNTIWSVISLQNPFPMYPSQKQTKEWKLTTDASTNNSYWSISNGDRCSTDRCSYTHRYTQLCFSRSKLMKRHVRSDELPVEQLCMTSLLMLVSNGASDLLQLAQQIYYNKQLPAAADF